MSDIQRQVLNCPECHRTFRFNLDFELDGNHEITCPGCGHIHYRVITNGKITEDRFNLNPCYTTYVATNYYITPTSTSNGSGSTTDWGYTGTGGTTCGTRDHFIRNAWMNSTSTT